MSRNSPVSYRDSAPMGRLLLARIPAACQRAFEAFGRVPRATNSVASFPGKLLFEALEPRLLLSADLGLAASPQVPQSQPEGAYAASSTPLSLSDDAASGGPAVVRVSGSAASGADWWRLDLQQGDIVSIGVDTPNSEMDPYVSLRDASGTEIAADDNSGSGNDAAISQQEILLTGTYYVQVRPAGDGTVSGPYELLVERTRVTEPEPASLGRSDTPAAMDAASFGAQPAAVLQARWVGGSGNWSDPTHWDIGVVPNDTATETYEVILDLADSPTITIDQDVSVTSLTNSETLVVDGVSLTIAQQTDNSGSIQLAGAGARLNLSGTVHDTGEILASAGTLNLSDATVTVDGPTAQVTAAGAATLNSVDLYAVNGGVLSLAGATTFTSRAGGSTIQASGAASKVDLSGLTDLVGGSSGATQIEALSGGEVAVSGDVVGRSAWTLDGSGGMFDVSGVTSLSDAVVNVSGGAVLAFSSASRLARTNLMATDGGQILFPAATSYANGVRANYDLTASGVGSRIDLSQLASMVGSDSYHGNRLAITASDGGEVDLGGAISGYTVITLSGSSSVLNVAGVESVADSYVGVSNGGTVNFAALTQLTRVSLNASGGGQMLFPAATSYGNGVRANYDLTASGVGSRIDLSQLTSMVGSDSYHGNRLAITASDGGEVDLAGAIGGYTVITVDGSSALGVAGITGLSNVSLTSDRALNFASATQIADSQLTAQGQTFEFPVVTSLARVSLSASGGGQLLFPAATSYANGVRANYDLTASGVGSRIDLSQLASMVGSDSYHGNRLAITASDGGEVDLGGAISGYTVITLSGSSSVLNVAGVESVADSYVGVSNGGTVNFAALTQLTRVSLNASGGGQMLFPAATSYGNGVRANYDLTASGVGSRIDLSQLTSMVGSDSYHGNRLAITASDGGEVDLAGAIGGYTVITVDGSSALGVAGITGLSNVSLTSDRALNFASATQIADSQLTAQGQTFEFPVVTSLARVSLSASGGGQLLFPAATSYANGVRANYDLTASGVGSRIDLSQLASMVGSDSYHGNRLAITASDGGEVDLGGAISGYTVITLSGSSSVLNVAGVESVADSYVGVSNGGTVNFAALTQLTRVSLNASGGGQMLFPAATSYGNGVRANYDLTASGVGSRIDLSQLTSMVGSDSYHGNRLAITASDGGEVDLAGAIGGYTVITVDGSSALGVAGITGLSNVSLTSDRALNFASATQIADSQLTAQGQTFEFPVVTSLARVSLSASGGGQLLFPAATSYANGVRANYDLTASGVGSRIDLSQLASMVGSDSYHGNRLAITASDGGEVDLGGAISGYTVITLSGSSSVLNVAGVESVADSYVGVSNGGTVNFAALTQLTRVSLNASGGGQMLFPAATSYGNGVRANYDLTASGVGSRIDLSQLTSMVGSDSYHGNRLAITASDGGEVDLAGAIGGYTVITVDGSSALGVAGITGLSNVSLTSDRALNFASATQIADSQLTAQGQTFEFPVVTSLARVSLSASGGGQLLFPAATSYANGVRANYDLTASGVGSRIDLSQLASMVGSDSYHGNRLAITASDGGEVDLGGAISGYTVITLSGSSSVLNVAGVESVADSYVGVSNGGTVNFAALTQLTRVSLNASGGGQMLFPAATSYGNGVRANYDLTASGVGSRIDLSQLTSMVGSDSYHGNRLAITASDGGEVDLAGAIGGYTVITANGTGSVLDVAGITSISGTALTAANGAVWTFPAGWHPTWGSGNTLSTIGSGSQFVNRGTISISGASLPINGGNFINHGVLSLQTGGIFDFNGLLRVDELGILTGVTAGTFNISGDLLGATRNADRYAPQALVRFDGDDAAPSLQQLEVMGRELSDDPAGFSRNFVYGTLELSNNTYLKLVDLSDNAAGTDPEALYINSLIVADGATLDLNGLHLYTRAAQISGTSTIIGGSIIQIPDSGAINMASPTPGAISTAGQLDEWSFFARGGQSITVAVDTGGSGVLPPALDWAHVELVDEAGMIIASEDSTAPGQVVTLEDVAIPADGTYRLRIKAPVDHLAQEGNYLATVWDVTADASPLLLNRQVTGLIENPYSVDQWQFSVTAGTQVRFDLINRSSTGILFDLSGPGGWVGFTDLDRDSDLLTLPSDGTYTLAAQGTGGHTGGSYAFQMQQTRVTDLALGSFQTGQFAGSGQAELFRIDVPTSNPLKVVLDDDASNNVSELYLKFGAPPTRADYDYRFTSSAAPDHEIVVPMAYAGQWYALVYGDTIRSNSSFDISATSNGVYLSAVTPDRYAADATATLTLTGAGFDATTTFSLVATGPTAIPAASVVVVSPTRATANFSLAGLTPGMYSLLASEPGGVSDVLVNGFTVTGAGAGQLDIQLVVPSVLGRQATATLYVDYANTGNEAIPAPLLILSSDDPDGSDRPLMTLDQARVGPGFWTSAVPTGFSSSVQFLTTGSTPGLLQPGETGRIPVYFIGLEGPWDFADRTVEFVVAVARDDGNTVDWNSIGDSTRPDYVRPDAWQAIWSNLVSNVGGTWTGYLAALNENASFLGNLGASTSEVSRLFGFELRQAEGLNPIRYLASSTQAAMPAPGPDLVFSQAYAQPISRRFELGPLGRGWANNWQLSLATEADGTVRITDMTGTPRIFEPDRRAFSAPAAAARHLVLPPGPLPSPAASNIHYTAAAGDHGILTSYVGGSFMLTESDGTQYYFRADGKLEFVRDTNGNRINCTYTGALLTGLTHTSGQSLTLAYNAAERITSVTDSDSRQSLYTYDASNQHLLSVQDYDGRVTSYSYLTGQGAAKDHALSEVAFPDGSHRYYTYDSHGRLANTYRDGGVERITFSYDTAGTVTATDALGNPSHFFFDDWGTILKSTNPLGNSVLLSLDANRNLSSVTDPAGRTSLFQYDAGDNLTRFTDAMGNATSFTYTADFNRLDKLTDANGNLTDYNYDSHGNLTNITYADGSQERWAYDGLGQSTDLDQPPRHAGRVHLRRRRPDHAQDLRRRHARRLPLRRARQPDQRHRRHRYDHAHLRRPRLPRRASTTPAPAGASSPTPTTAGGRRATSTDQLGHTLHYQYDAAGRLSRITDETTTQIVLYQYDAAGRMALKTLGNGVYTTYDYDAAGQLLHLVNHKSDANRASRASTTPTTAAAGASARARSTAPGPTAMTTSGSSPMPSLRPPIPRSRSQDLLYVYDAMGNRVRTVENGVTTALHDQQAQPVHERR
jgi:YD repeat-containing protein